MPNHDEQLKVYEQLCNSYRAIDDFRAKLLGFLPPGNRGWNILSGEYAQG